MTDPAGPACSLKPPADLQVFVDPDGSVTFSDLTAELLDVARALDPDARPGGGSGPMIGDVTPVFLDGDAVVMLDQRLLPQREVWLRFRTPEDVATAIRDMVVRGAPAIGIAAAMGVAIAANGAADDAATMAGALESACDHLKNARPTAVNLAWAVERMRARARAVATLPAAQVRSVLRGEAQAILDEDVAMNRALGRHGAVLIPDGACVMTHCNAGALATGGYGTALGVLRAAREAGRNLRVVSCETRPYLQGARLTSWELTRDGFDVTLITDNAAGHLMARGEITCVIVGADRIAANGDTANKIGTYTHAVVANRHGIPFYVAAPSSTLDPAIPDGTHIPIEERAASEVTHFAGVRVAAEGVRVRNPGFDVTPWPLIQAIVTERGVHRPGPNGYTLGLTPDL